jgi:serralysin
MSKVKEKAIVSAAQVSSAYSQIDSFSHQYDRGGNVLVNGKPSFSVDQAANQILRDHASWQDLNGSGKIELTYTFLTSPAPGFAALNVGTFSQFSSLQKAQAVLSMQSWADVANVTFTESAKGGDAHMTFGNYSNGDNGGAAFAFLPETGSIYNGQSWYLTGDGYNVNKTPGLNNYGRQTLTHEIGHTLGLAHPGDYNAGEGNPTYNDASYGQDTRGYSVMSY